MQKNIHAILAAVFVIALFGTSGLSGNPIIGDFSVVDSQIEDIDQNAVWFEGTFGKGSITNSGPFPDPDIPNLETNGTRFFWFPGKAAIRGGRQQFSSDGWHASNIGNYSFAFGHNTKASGEGSVAFGYGGRATGEGSVAFGGVASGDYSFAAGGWAGASEDHSFAFGEDTWSSGGNSVAFSMGRAGGWGAVAFGDWTYALGSVSLAHGFESYATGDASTAIGWWNTASGKKSTAFGNHTTAQGYAQFVVGQNNVPQGNPAGLSSSADLLFIVGNGDMLSDWETDAPSNAFTVAYSGDAAVQRHLTVGGDLTVTGAVNFPGSFQVNSFGRVFAPSGSSGAGNLAYSFAGDTGFYRSANNEIRFQTNGNDRMTIGPAGQIGIGTAAPVEALDVVGNVSWTGDLIDGSVPWERLTNVPPSFPTSVAQVSGLEDELDTKFDSTGGEVTGDTTINGKLTVTGEVMVSHIVPQGDIGMGRFGGE